METVAQNVWSKSKLLVKGVMIGFIVLLLQIPAYYVKDLIAEREQRQQEAITEISSKWAGKQIITGPLMVLPYWKTDSDTAAKRTRSKHNAYFLPENLNITAKVIPQEKHRGLYKVILYTSTIGISGNFPKPQLQELNILPEDVIWSEAVLKLPISDNKGLNEEIKIKINDSNFVLTPQPSEEGPIKNALQAAVRVNTPDYFNEVRFSSSYTLSGSQQIMFTPTGKVTSVNLRSSWPHPSFTGDVLPQATGIKDTGFTATWKSVSYKRNFPQQWKDESFQFHNIEPAPGFNREIQTTTTAMSTNNINKTSFGADLFIPVNSYQKTMRSVKYASLILLLTFASFFLIEINNKKSVHPFQYGLIGAALILFYTLLLSFSEYLGFNISYAIASVATILLIGWFVKDLLSSSRLATILSTILVLLYVYILTILQLQDYSLLFGSIGLFVTLAVIMNYSKKLNW